jgi:hypothetical protein
MRIKNHNNKKIPKLMRYSALHKTFAIIIHQILQGLFSKLPVHIGIDNFAFVKNYQGYEKMPLTWWQNHISTYRVVDCSVAVSSVWIQLNQRRTNDIFEGGSYFYNSNAGSFEITIDPKGLFSLIFAEFDGQTPGFIPQLLQDFPGCGFPTKDELLQDISNNRIMNDTKLLEGLRPIPYRLMEVD